MCKPTGFFSFPSIFTQCIITVKGCAFHYNCLFTATTICRCVMFRKRLLLFFVCIVVVVVVAVVVVGLA